MSRRQAFEQIHGRTLGEPTVNPVIARMVKKAVEQGKKDLDKFTQEQAEAASNLSETAFTFSEMFTNIGPGIIAIVVGFTAGYFFPEQFNKEISYVVDNVKDLVLHDDEQLVSEAPTPINELPITFSVTDKDVGGLSEPALRQALRVEID